METHDNHGTIIDALRSYRVPIALIGVSIILVVVATALLVQSTRIVAPIEFSSEATTSGTAGTLTVDIEGAVVAPGVYALPVGSRVEDAIRIAGGLTEDADQTYVSRVLNRAGKLTDGAKIFIPTPSESPSNVSDEPVVGGGSESVGVDVVSVNSASQAELELLPGIGPVTAQKIITNRPYLTLEELVARKVLRPSLFEELKNSLSL